MLTKIGKYLGIPSDWGKSEREMFAWILSQINSKIEGWKEQFLSKGGKETLIKMVI